MNKAVIPIQTDLISVAAAGSLGSYLHTIGAIPVLSREDEVALAIRYRTDTDLDAARQLVLSHLRFVVHIARGYQGYGLQLG